MKKQANFFLRSIDGHVVEVPSKFKYLEIRTTDDLVTHVFAAEDNKIIMFTKEDPEAVKYQGTYSDVNFGNAITLDQLKEDIKSGKV